MQTDPRSRNQYFPQKEIHRYLKEYTGAVAYALNKVTEQDIEFAHELLRLTHQRGGRIFVGGNGGSAAISDHLCCDFVKGTYSDKTNSLLVHPLNGSTALFTAIANDFGYEHTLRFQLKAAQLTSKDLVILISSSGNSANIVGACDEAFDRATKIIGMTGFDGGELKKRADCSLHVPINNYGVVEDCHQILMHVLAQFHFLSTNE